MTDLEILAAAQAYTKASIAGIAVIEGKPCQIQSIAPITGGNRVTFLWVDNDGNEHTSTMDVMDGEKGETGATGATGNGIASVEKTSTSGLVDTYTITYTDGTTTTFTVTNGSDATVTVDDEMSDSSENPVENRVIKSYVDGSVGTITDTQWASIQGSLS